MAHQRLGIHAAQLFFTHGEGHHGHVFGLQACIAQLFVERHVGVAVDGGHHRSLATGSKLLDVGDDGLVVRVTEGGVGFLNVGILHALAVQVSAQNFVGGAGVHVVGAQQHKALGAAAFFAHQVIHRWNSLLVGRSTGVEHVLGQFFTLVLHGVEQEAVELFDHGQHRLAGHGSPAAENHSHFVLGEQLFGFFSEQRPVAGGVHHHGFELLAQHTALGIDFVNRHQRSVFQHSFRNGHRAGQAVQDADLDGIGRKSGNGCQGRQRDGSGECLQGKATRVQALHVDFSGVKKRDSRIAVLPKGCALQCDG